MLRDSVYYDSPGLNPNATGISNGVLKKVNDKGFGAYSKDNTRGDTILYLGDSITMGIGVEPDSTFAGIINNECNQVVLNSSMIGYSVMDYLNVINKIIDEDKNGLNISQVHLFWCLSDVYDSIPDDNSPERGSDGLLNKAGNFFKRNFKLYYFLKNTFADRPKSYFLYDEQFYNHKNKYFLQSLSALRQISEILKSRNIPLTIFLLPYEYQLRKRNFQSFRSQKLLADSLTYDRIEVHNLCEHIGRASQNPGELYLYGDGIHFSKHGHKVIANYIEKWDGNKNDK
ncbi:MAG: hypothetical protein V1720_20195 [bacterium]